MGAFPFRAPVVVEQRAPALPRAIPVFPELTPVEQRLLAVALDKDRFLLGPSFHDCHHRAIAVRIHNATPILKDAYIASAGICGNDHPDLGPAGLDKNSYYRRAASAVASLPSLKIRNSYDSSICLALGVAILTFAQYMAGDNASQICRYVLTSIKPVYETQHKQFSSDDLAFLICLLTTETAECLFQNTVPTIRFQPPGEGFVDRYLGLSSSSLTYLYDICKLSNALFHSDSQNHPTLMRAGGLLSNTPCTRGSHLLPQTFSTASTRQR